MGWGGGRHGACKHRGGRHFSWRQTGTCCGPAVGRLEHTMLASCSHPKSSPAVTSHVSPASSGRLALRVESKQPVFSQTLSLSSVTIHLPSRFPLFKKRTWLPPFASGFEYRGALLHVPERWYSPMSSRHKDVWPSIVTWAGGWGKAGRWVKPVAGQGGAASERSG